MIKLENFEVVGWEHAIRGMRNPMNSWDKSDSWHGCKCGDYGHTDSRYCEERCKCDCEFCLGYNDLELMKKLAKSGTDHRKFMRMITVYVDVTAPLYWWKEYSTYKVGTVANSCSTMHKITAKEFTLDDFSTEHLVPDTIEMLENTIEGLNVARELYNDFEKWKGNCSDDITCKKDAWWQMIQLLPTSYNQKRTLMLNYEVLANIYHSRKNHKLDEWVNFCKWIESLPYAKELICNE